MCEFWQSNASFEQSYVDLTARSEAITGYVHALDPESGTVCLLSPDRNLHLIHPDDIIRMEKCDNTSSKSILKLDTTTSHSEVILTCDQLLDRLNERGIKANITDQGDLKSISVFDGIATINPPYDISNCVCDNEIVLAKIAKVLQEISHKSRV